jgi:hypothetical protein
MVAFDYTNKSCASDYTKEIRMVLNNCKWAKLFIEAKMGHWRIAPQVVRGVQFSFGIHFWTIE